MFYTWRGSDAWCQCDLIWQSLISNFLLPEGNAFNGVASSVVVWFQLGDLLFLVWCCMVCVCVWWEKIPLHYCYMLLKTYLIHRRWADFKVRVCLLWRSEWIGVCWINTPAVLCLCPWAVRFILFHCCSGHEKYLPCQSYICFKHFLGKSLFKI